MNVTGRIGTLRSRLLTEALQPRDADAENCCEGGDDGVAGTDLTFSGLMVFEVSLDAGITEVVSFTVPPNLASQAGMQRIGMRYDGVFHHPAARPDEWWGPHVLYRVDREAAAVSRSSSGWTDRAGDGPVR